MKKILFLSILFFTLAIPYSCEDMDDKPVPAYLQINDFVWKGMNTYYLWKDDVPDLSNNKDSNQDSFNNFLSQYKNPTDLFNHLKVSSSIDRFSRIYNDYTVLEGSLTGNTLNNGMDYGLKTISKNSTEVLGWVRYILPNSDAATKDIHRGDVFYAVNGIPLTTSNFNSLLSSDSYTINLADYNYYDLDTFTHVITPNGKSVTLTGTQMAENPIFLNTVISQNNHNIGYLLYNGFYSAYDNQLNAVFGDFVSQNVTDLVLDLRYNPGGSINTAVKLASMITGQFPDQLFAKEQWNNDVQSYFLDNNPNSLNNNFIKNLNSLHLNKVYILTSNNTASASELVINCLKPYIDVVQIGDTTVGKNVGSITVYDSPTFTKNKVNPNHKYAMQPIVLKIVNKNNFGDYTAGITPNDNNLLKEDLSNLGVLSNVNEPLLSHAIGLITATAKKTAKQAQPFEGDFIDSKSINPIRTEMYLERK